MNAEPTRQQLPRVSEIMPGAYYPTPYSAPPAAHYQQAGAYHHSYVPVEARLPGPVPITHAPGHGHKRLARPHPAESPAKKKQSKWSNDEDRLITELRGNGMKWEDISKHLPGRSAISCRLRFQNYLERRPEWDEEKMNKLARLYERFRKDMWEKIAKEMQIPWRAAENMHWQMGEIDMANRANVPVFQLATGRGGTMPDRVPSTSPPSRNDMLPTMPYSQTHNHSLPQVSMSQHQQISPAHARMARENGSSSPNGHPPLRRRADSATSVPTVASMNSNVLPPLGEVVRHSTPPARYGLAPVLTPIEPRQRIQ